MKRPSRILAEAEPRQFPQGLFPGQWGGQEWTKEGALAGGLFSTLLLLGASLPHKRKNLWPQPAVSVSPRDCRARGVSLGREWLCPPPPGVTESVLIFQGLWEGSGGAGGGGWSERAQATGP